MDDPGGSTYFAAALCLLLSAFFSGSEAALFSSDLIRLKTSFGKSKGLQRVLALKDDAKTVLSSILLGNTFVNVMFSSMVAVIVFSWSLDFHGLSDFLATVLGTLFVLIFGEITPKSLAMGDPEKTAVRVSPALDLINRLASPISGALEKIASSMARLLPSQEWQEPESPGEARLRAAVEYGEDSGLIRQDEKKMIYGVIEAQDLEVKDVMVPRPRMVALEENKSAYEMLELMLAKGLSRIPVFSDSKDNITGVVTIKDIAGFASEDLDGWRESLRRLPAKAFALPAYFVPESKKVSDLMYEMKKAGVYMAIVVDEFDGISGLCTLEDLLEEIVGDIQDEYDQEKPSAMELSPGLWQVSGSMSLSDLEDATGISIEMEDCDTVAGVIMKCLDRVPHSGDSFCLLEPRVCFEIVEVKGPRIEKAMMKMIMPDDYERNQSLEAPAARGASV